MKTKRLGLEELCVIMTRMNIFSSKQKNIDHNNTEKKLLYLPGAGSNKYKAYKVKI